MIEAQAPILFFKAHVRGYTRKDGTAVRPHEDNRQASLFDLPPMARTPAPAPEAPAVLFFDTPQALPNVSNLINNGSMETQGSPMNQYPITVAALSPRMAKNFADEMATLWADGPIIKSRYADMRQSLSQVYREVSRSEVSGPYIAMPHEIRPQWFEDVYYGAGELSSLKKAQKLCQARAGDPLADRALAMYAEWTPIVARLEARKADITTAAAMREEKKVAERKAAEAIPKTALSELVSAAVDARKPQLAAEYVAYVGRLYATMVSKLGAGFEGLNEKKNEGLAKLYDNTLRAVLDSGRGLDADKLAAAGQRYADDVANAMRGKIMDKAGDLGSPELRHLSGMNFSLTGTLGGKKVLIEQNTIVNVSPLGTMFNQYPARIYIDGKFTPEAQYKRDHLGAS